MTVQITERSSKPAYWDEAARYLMRRDRIMRRLIPQFPDEWPEAGTSAFATLVRIVISQQLSIRAAHDAWQQFVATCGDNPDPDAVLRASRDDSLGWLAQRKREYVIGLAEHFAEAWSSLPCWKGMDNEAVISSLCEIRGVGRWSAEMFLIFSLRRPDVLPLDDAGLIRAISLHYFSGEPVSRFEAREVAQAWSPWRSVAVWYLWRSLDPLVVHY